MKRGWTLLVALGLFGSVLQAAEWYVDSIGIDLPGHGTTPVAPFRTIGYAIQAAASGDLVVVAPGVYGESDLVVDKSLTIRGAGAGATVVNGGAAGLVFFLYGVSNTIVLEDMSIMGGNAIDGGGVLCVAANASLIRCAIGLNYSDEFGGGARNHYGTLRLVQCRVLGNHARKAGGGVYGARLESCLVAFNEATNGTGGGVAACDLFNCTVASNRAAVAGGSADGAAWNSIVFFNESADSATLNYQATRFTDSCATPLPDGVGNIDSSPIFVDLIGFEPFITSPTINRGRPEWVFEPFDLNGADRLQDDLPDMGAVEFVSWFVPARIPVFSGSLDFGLVAAGSVVTQSLWLVNRGNAVLNVAGFTAPDGFSASMADPAVAPGGTGDVTVVFAPTRDGSYGGTLLLLSDRTWGDESTAVSGEGDATPTLAVAPLQVAASCVEGEDAANGFVTVSNASGYGEMAFTVSSDAAWIVVTPADGTSTGEADTVTLVFSTAGLAAGVYTGFVEVAAAGAVGSPAGVDVTLTVLPNRLPEAPIPLAPAAGAELVMTQAVAFSWTAPPGAARYHLWIGTNGCFFTNAWIEGAGATNGLIEAPFGQGDYLWMVAGSNWLGYGPWSTAVLFTVVRERTPDGGVVLPLGTAPELRWTETPGAAQYELEVERYNLGAGAWVLYAADAGAAPAGVWAAPALFSKGSYRWRIREQTEGVWSGWDDWAYFQVAVPPVPEPVRPVGVEYLWKSVPFRWTPVEAATAYQLEVRKAGAVWYRSPWQSGRVRRLALSPNPAVYRWRVRARTEAGVGAWSPLVKLERKALPAPDGLTPSGNEVQQPDAPVTFRWNPVPSADRHEVVIRGGAEGALRYQMWGADSSTFAAVLPLAAGRYTWRVRAGNADGWGPWSAPAEFRMP